MNKAALCVRVGVAWMIFGIHMQAALYTVEFA